MARLPILMYHNVCGQQNPGVGLTVSVDDLEQQFKFLAENGYQSYHFSELKHFEKNNSLPPKAVIITFDDVYVSQLDYAYPLLKKYNLKASFFIPFNYVGEIDKWNTNTAPIMSVEQLKSLDGSIVELGLHSFYHKKYDEMPIDTIQNDFELCRNFIEKNSLNVNNVLAYPYGKYPRKEPAKDVFFNCLDKHNMQYGLRIGNRVNHFPFKNNYEVKRIDVKGEDTFLKFKLKLRFGKLKLF